MKEITQLQEVQKIALDILLYVDRVCKEHKFHYFMSDGTLLGAVRHKGFIPWDDDIDIWMPREDYKKIAAVINEDQSCPYYRLFNWENTKGYTYAFSKVVDTRTLLVENIDQKCEMGVYIDIFPYDGLPGKTREDHLPFVRRALALDQHRYRAFCNFSRFKTNNFFKNIRRFATFSIRKIIGGKNIIRRMEMLAQKYPVEGSAFVGGLTSGYKEKDMMPAWICEKTVDMDFEGHVLQAPVGYKEFLEIEYGDFMELPPVEKRVSHHDFKAWWKQEM